MHQNILNVLNIVILYTRAYQSTHKCYQWSSHILILVFFPSLYCFTTRYLLLAFNVVKKIQSKTKCSKVDIKTRYEHHIFISVYIDPLYLYLISFHVDTYEQSHKTCNCVSTLTFILSAITQRAIRITSCICVADRKTRENSMKIKDNKLHDHDDDSEHKEEKELGEHINHAGRLLVNHGYIEDAIKTQNKTFLDNSTVKNILNEMWYGTEKLNFRTVSLRL